MPTTSPLDAPFGQPWQGDFEPGEFAARRDRIYDALGPGALALIQGAPVVRGFRLFRQSNEFYYCCGAEVPQAVLLLDASARRATLFVSRPDGVDAPQDAEALRALAGLEAALPVAALADHLPGAGVIFTPHAPAEGQGQCRDNLTWAERCAAADPWDGLPTREQRFQGLLRERCPGAGIRDLSPILDALRSVKSAAEVAVMRRAGDLAARAATEAMRATRPGRHEYHLGAIAEFTYVSHGARGEGYRTIAASGANVWDAHYFHNCCPLGDGDLVLLDTAPDLGGYTSDIGRMWPVNGTYAPWQRELYGFMVQYHQTLLSLIRPGALAEEILAAAAAQMAPVVEATRFSKPCFEAAARRALEFKGHLSHPVGMAVHDVGSYGAEPLRPGTVFAVDPQLWVPEEKLYLRCEDTVAVTEKGMENLTAAAPLELDAVEALMREVSAFPLAP